MLTADGDASDTGRSVYDVPGFRSCDADERDDAECDGTADRGSVGVHVPARRATAQRVWQRRRLHDVRHLRRRNSDNRSSRWLDGVQRGVDISQRPAGTRSQSVD